MRLCAADMFVSRIMALVTYFFLGALVSTSHSSYGSSIFAVATQRRRMVEENNVEPGTLTTCADKPNTSSNFQQLGKAHAVNLTLINICDL